MNSRPWPLGPQLIQPVNTNAATQAEIRQCWSTLNQLIQAFNQLGEAIGQNLANLKSLIPAIDIYDGIHDPYLLNNTVMKDWPGAEFTLGKTIAGTNYPQVVVTPGTTASPGSVVFEAAAGPVTVPSLVMGDMTISDVVAPFVLGIAVPDPQVYIAMTCATGTPDNNVWSYYSDPSGNWNVQCINDAWNAGTSVLSLLRRGNPAAAVTPGVMVGNSVTDDGTSALLVGGPLTIFGEGGSPGTYTLAESPYNNTALVLASPATSLYLTLAPTTGVADENIWAFYNAGDLHIQCINDAWNADADSMVFARRGWPSSGSNPGVLVNGATDDGTSALICQGQVTADTITPRSGGNFVGSDGTSVGASVTTGGATFVNGLYISGAIVGSGSPGTVTDTPDDNLFYVRHNNTGPGTTNGVWANLATFLPGLAASTAWAGSTSVTKVGTVTTGTWQGTAVADAYIASASTWTNKQDHLGTGWTSALGNGAAGQYLGNGPAWANLTSITAVGTVTTGTWSAAISTAATATVGGLSTSGASTLGAVSGTTLTASSTTSVGTFTANGNAKVTGELEVSGSCVYFNAAHTGYIRLAGSTFTLASTSLAVGTITTGVWNGSTIDDAYLTEDYVTGAELTTALSAYVTTSALAGWTGNTSLTSTGTVTIGTWATSINTTAVAIVGGISTSGTSTLAAVTCTTLGATGSCTIGGGLSVTGTTTLGTVNAGTLGLTTKLSDSYIASASTWNNALQSSTFTTWTGGASSLASWTGSGNLATVGTITSGTWHGTAIADGYIASAATWNALVGLPAGGSSTQYLRGDKTWQTLNAATIGLGSVENTALSTWAGTTNLTTAGALSATSLATSSTISCGGYVQAAVYEGTASNPLPVFRPYPGTDGAINFQNASGLTTYFSINTSTGILNVTGSLIASATVKATSMVCSVFSAYTDGAYGIQLKNAAGTQTALQVDTTNLICYPTHLVLPTS